MIINPEAVFNVAGIEKSWDEFEKFASENEEKLKSIEKHVAWDIWTASRQALVAELKKLEPAETQSDYEDGLRDGFNMGIAHAEAALDKAGVSYK